MRFSMLAAGAIAACLTGVACTAGSPPLVDPVGETHKDPSSTGGQRPLGHDEPSSAVSVFVGDEVRRACKLPDAPPELPLFGVEEKGLRPLGDDPLARVATCIGAGGLGGHKLWIIGHADRRGKADYNYQLGLYRAEAAKQHLLALGAAAVHLRVESAGAGEASGTDEASWPSDHRIEVHLGNAARRSLHRPEPRARKGR